MKSQPLFHRAIVVSAAWQAVCKLDPRHQAKNPVMFVVLVGSIATTGIGLRTLDSFTLAVSAWLWFTVLFGNFAEAMAEGRGKAQADTLRKSRKDVPARKLAEARREAAATMVSGGTLGIGDFVLVEAGEVIPMDGEVVE